MDMDNNNSENNPRNTATNRAQSGIQHHGYNTKSVQCECAQSKKTIPAEIVKHESVHYMIHDLFRTCVSRIHDFFRDTSWTVGESKIPS